MNQNLVQIKLNRRVVLLNIIESTDFDIYENAIAKTIQNLTIKKQKLVSKLKIVHEKIKEIPRESWMDESVVYSTKEFKLITRMGDINAEQASVEAHLRALNEMKIVNLFKELEIKMKLMIEFAYPDVNVKSFYKWDNMITFLKSKNIEVSKLKYAKDIEDLKTVNNTIKHHNRITNEIKRIKEFSKAAEIESDDLDRFYSKLKPCIMIFLNGLLFGVWNDLYVFNNTRIDELVKSYHLRMDGPIIKKFAEKLLEYPLNPDV